MTDPLRITEPGLAKTLVDSLAADCPSDEARRAAAAALGQGGGPVPPSSPATPSPSSASAKVAVGALTVGLLTVGVLALRHATRPSAPTPPAAPVIVPVRAEPAAVLPAPPESPAQDPAIAPAQPLNAAPTRRAPVRPTAPRPAERPTRRAAVEPAPDLSTLAAETALLDAARAALRRSAPADAIDALDRHAAQFPSGVLAVEASALRVEALFQRGDRAAAFALADDFLAHHGDSALANRVRAAVAAQTSVDQNAATRH